MISLIEYIQEGLKIGHSSKVEKKKTFTDEELRDDYNEVSGAYTKAEKDAFKEKYGVTSNKIRDIQIEILNCLRDNRNKKTEFDDEDVKYFIRYDLPMNYDKQKEYFDQEPKKFLMKVLQYYCNRGKRINPNPARRSINDNYVLKRIAALEKYLDIHS